MPIDFNKLRDPAYQAQMRQEREAEEAKRDAHDKLLRAAVDDCLVFHESVSEKELSLVRSCRDRLNLSLTPSPAQEKWLLDIVKRVRAEEADRVVKIVERCAPGNADAGEHPTYSRNQWAGATHQGYEPPAYWNWVVRQIELYGGEAEHCEKCSARLDDAGYDGLCGNCADQVESGKIER